MDKTEFEETLIGSQKKQYPINNKTRIALKKIEEQRAKLEQKEMEKRKKESKGKEQLSDYLNYFAFDQSERKSTETRAMEVSSKHFRETMKKRMFRTMHRMEKSHQLDPVKREMLSKLARKDESVVDESILGRTWVSNKTKLLGRHMEKQKVLSPIVMGTQSEHVLVAASKTPQCREEYMKLRFSRVEKDAVRRCDRYLYIAREALGFCERENKYVGIK